MEKKRIKSGISLIILMITILVSLILLGALITTGNRTVKNVEATNFANELIDIREAVTAYYLLNNEMPSENDATYLSQKEILDIVETNKRDSFMEALQSNGDYVGDETLGNFYKIDLGKIEVEKTQRGLYNGGIDDVYVVAYPSMQIYYLKGVNINENYHFAFTEKLIGLTTISNQQIADNSKTTIELTDAIKVSKNEAAWTNQMGINITTYLEPTETLYIKLADITAEKQMRAVTGINTISFNSLEELVSKNLLTTTLSASDIKKFAQLEGDKKTIEIIKKRAGATRATSKIVLSNYDTTAPTLDVIAKEEYDSMKLYSLSVSDTSMGVISGLKEINYEYIQNVSGEKYYPEVDSFDQNYMLNKAKKVDASNIDSRVEIKVPKDVDKIRVAVVDKAGNVVIKDFFFSI